METISRAFPQEMSLVDRLKRKKEISPVALICDISGSMNQFIESERRKIDALRDIVKDLPIEDVYVFNHEVRKTKKDKIPNPSGSTVMSTALNTIKDDGFKKAIIVTDGVCDHYDKEKTLQAVKGILLNIIYVGPDPKPDFLDKLAASAGGQCTLEDLKNPKSISEKIQLLLEKPKEDNTTGVIQL